MPGSNNWSTERPRVLLSTCTFESRTHRISYFAVLYDVTMLFILGLIPTGWSPFFVGVINIYILFLIHLFWSVPIISREPTDLYSFISCSTIGTAGSSAEATENIISNFGYCCSNEDRRLSASSRSTPLRGRIMDTPGASAPSFGETGLGFRVYRVWLIAPVHVRSLQMTRGQHQILTRRIVPEDWEGTWTYTRPLESSQCPSPRCQAPLLLFVMRGQERGTKRSCRSRRRGLVVDISPRAQSRCMIVYTAVVEFIVYSTWHTEQW